MTAECLFSQGLAGLLAAPSTPELRGIGWSGETSLALELLSRALLDWMDEAKRSGAEDPDGGGDPGGYFSMSECLFFCAVTCVAAAAASMLLLRQCCCCVIAGVTAAMLLLVMVVLMLLLR